MGKSKIKKRITLQKQIAVSYIKVLALSLITAVFAIVMFYFVYYRTTGFDSSKMKDMSKILEYAYRNGSSVIDKEYRDELDEMFKKNEMAYNII